MCEGDVPLSLFNSGKREAAGEERTGGAVTYLPSRPTGGEEYKSLHPDPLLKSFQGVNATVRQTFTDVFFSTFTVF